MPDSSDFFILSIVTHDSRAIAKSVVDLKIVSEVLGRHFVLNVQSGTGITNARTKCLKAIKDQFPDEDMAYTFWLDSDIILNESPRNIAEYVREAERLGVSFTGNYRIIDNVTNKKWNVVAPSLTSSAHYTDEQLAAAKPFELRCAFSGLGLCYMKMPLDYRFRQEGQELEDFFFFKDNPDMNLRYVPISNYHMKSVPL